MVAEGRTYVVAVLEHIKPFESVMKTLPPLQYASCLKLWMQHRTESNFILEIYYYFQNIFLNEY